MSVNSTNSKLYAGLPEGTLFGMGNPLLDVAATTGTDMLHKYGLKDNDAILADEKHRGLCEELSKSYEVDYIAGGATQNSIKIAQWMVGKPRVTTYMGCIGKDKFGEILRDKCKSRGVNVQYQYTEKEPTGTCACLITGDNHENRSLVANLAAANCFTKEHLDDPQHKALMERAKYFYIAGFFLTVSPPSIMEVAEHACKENKVLVMNLSAPFLSQFFKEPLMKALPYVDILCGNETEAVTFAKECLHAEYTEKDLAEIALKICELPKKNEKRKRIVVITHGSEDTVVAQGGKVTTYPVIPIKPEDIVDTNGAGDAFVGGFLSQLIIGKELNECVRAAHYVANLVIQRHGCTFPEKPDFD